MTHPEQTPRSELQRALAAIDHQIEVAEANENPIERTYKLDDLLEQRDWLEALLADTQEDES